MSVEEYMNRGCCEETMGKPSGLSQVPARCDCSVMPDWIVEAGLGQFGIRDANNDCRVVARCDTFKDAMRIAKLLNAETPNARSHRQEEAGRRKEDHR